MSPATRGAMLTFTSKGIFLSMRIAPAHVSTDTAMKAGAMVAVKNRKTKRPQAKEAVAFVL